MLCVCLSVSVSVSVWEGGDSRLREVTGKHGSKFLPFGGPPRPPIEFLFWDHWEKAVLGQILAGRISRVRSRGVMGGYVRLREVTEEENGGK